MTPPTTLLDRVRLRLRSRRDLERAVAAAEQDRDSARALAMGWRRERDAAEAHASHWRREVGELVGWQSEGRTDGALLRRLQRIVADGGRAQEVADRARDDEEAAYEAVRRVAKALRPGCKGFRLDDVVVWAEEAADEGSLLASREKLGHQAEQYEAELNAVDEALAKAGATPADDRVEFLQVLASQHRRGVAVAEQVADVVRERDLHRLAAEEAGNELDAIRDELRATGHPIGTRGLSYDVDAAIDRERSRAQDLVERLADVLGWPEHRGTWPFSAPHLVREIAVRLGRPMPRRRPHPSDWTPMGSRVARALRCTCRGDHGQGPTSIVDAECPEHSPGYRFGGWPVQPPALPSGIREPVGWPHDLGCGHQLIRLTHGGEVVPIARCRWLAGHQGLHGNATGRSWTGEPVRPVDDDVVDTEILDALDRWEGDATSGGWVCDGCGRPVDVLPCPEHQPLALADARAEGDGVPS